MKETIPPADVLAGIAEHPEMSLTDVYALVTDAERAPGIAQAIRERFRLSCDYDADGPPGLQLFTRGILPEREAQWYDGVIDESEAEEDEE